MELSEIRTFVAVAEAGSVNRAAERLRLSQPAVTRHVQRLERSLGTPLLDRRAKPVGLTTAGQAALEPCRVVLRAIDALAAAAASGEGPRGDCRIGVPPSQVDHALPGALEHLRERFPRVTIHVTTAWSRTLLGQVRAGDLDAALVQLPAGEEPPAPIAGRAFGTQPLLFVASRHERVAPEVRLDDLGGARWVLNPDGCGFRATLRRALQQIGAPLQVAVEAYGSDVQLALVARGLGFGIVPALALARSPSRAEIGTFRVKGHDLHLTVWSVRGRTPDALGPVLDAFDSRLADAFPIEAPPTAAPRRRGPGIRRISARPGRARATRGRVR